jgi:hypothetical protein
MLHGDTFVHHHPEMAMSRAMKEFKKGRPQRKHVADKMEAGNYEMDPEEGGEIDQEVNEQEENGEEVSEQEMNEQEVKEQEIEEELDLNNPHNADIENDGDGETGEDPDAVSTERVPTKLGGLKCDKWGGPDSAAADELAYWHDIPSDQDYVSPFRVKRGQHKKYMTFEPGMFL